MYNFKHVEAALLDDMFILDDDLGLPVHRQSLMVEDLEDYKVAREYGFKPEDILREFTYDLQETDKDAYIKLQEAAIDELSGFLHKHKIYFY